MARAAAPLAARWHPGQVRVLDDHLQRRAVTLVDETLLPAEAGAHAADAATVPPPWPGTV